MSNLSVAVASFWQLARHWNKGEKAKLELVCEDGSLHMQLSASLGHPDEPHFPQPPPSTSFTKKKSPSQLRRQERCRQEALNQNGKTGTAKDSAKEPPKEVSKESSNLPNGEAANEASNIPNGEAEKEKDSAEESLKKASKVIARNMAEKEKESVAVSTAKDAEEPSLPFVCDQCDYSNTTEKGLNQHVRMKHRISQVDGNEDFEEGLTRDSDESI